MKKRIQGILAITLGIIYVTAFATMDSNDDAEIDINNSDQTQNAPMNPPPEYISQQQPDMGGRVVENKIAPVSPENQTDQ